MKTVKHTFWHYVLTVLFLELNNVIWLFSGLVILVAGEALFFLYMKGSFFQLAVGLPLILSGFFLILFKIHEVILAFANPNRIEAMCKFCRKI